MSNIKVLVLEPGKEPEEREIENTLEAKQAVVGGYIEVVPLDLEEKYPLTDGKSLDLIVNEEGKINGLPFNRYIWDRQDAIMGTAMIAIGNPDSGEFESMTDEAIATAKKILGEWK